MMSAALAQKKRATNDKHSHAVYANTCWAKYVQFRGLALLAFLHQDLWGKSVHCDMELHGAVDFLRQLGARTLTDHTTMCVFPLPLWGLEASGNEEHDVNSHALWTYSTPLWPCDTPLWASNTSLWAYRTPLWA